MIRYIIINTDISYFSIVYKNIFSNKISQYYEIYIFDIVKILILFCIYKDYITLLYINFFKYFSFIWRKFNLIYNAWIFKEYVREQFKAWIINALLSWYTR